MIVLEEGTRSNTDTTRSTAIQERLKRPETSEKIPKHLKVCETSKIFKSFCCSCRAARNLPLRQHHAWPWPPRNSCPSHFEQPILKTTSGKNYTDISDVLVEGCQRLLLGLCPQLCEALEVLAWHQFQRHWKS